MCGIAGIYNSLEPGKRKSRVLQMLSLIQHRGPDSSGILHAPRITMGNVRLSIVDIEGGEQPISDASRRYWIVYNGEVFNHIELRKKLENRGVVFHTSSDTEVVLQMYIAFGAASLEMLNGQFAFAIWDQEEEELFLARDRVGIRPLYYHENGGSLVFASEIKSLLVHPDVPRELSDRGLVRQLTFWSAAPSSTVFKGISELPPGHYMCIGKGGVKVVPYWELTFQGRLAGAAAGSVDMTNWSIADHTEAFKEVFTTAVGLRLRADVDVAAYLSGGLDSTTIVSFIKELHPEILNTYSVAFEDKQYDERSYQQQAADYFNVNHTVTTCSDKDIAAGFSRAVWHAEAPLVRTAPVPMLRLSELVSRNGIKVVLTGEGADEMLAGYNIFKESEIRHFWARNPDSAFRFLLLSRLYPFLPQMANRSPKMFKMFFGYRLGETDHPFYSHLIRWNNSRHITRHIHDQRLEAVSQFDPLEELSAELPVDFQKWDTLERAQWIETSLFLSGYLLSSQGDRMGMANSVEGRYPFLDHHVIEFLASIPPTMKLKGLNEKFLLKELTRGRIPDTIRERPKQPYRAPVTSAFEVGNLTRELEYVLSEDFLKKAAIFNADSVGKLFHRRTDVSRVTEMDQMSMAAILSTQLLHYYFIEGENPDGLPGALKNTTIVELK